MQAKLTTGAIGHAEKAALVKELEPLVRHDSMTGLPNRAAIIERMHESTERWMQSGLQVNVCYIDFGKVQDLDESYRHDTGERAILHLAGKLSAMLRPADLLAHLGSGKFILLMEDPAADDAATLRLQAISDQFRQAAMIDGNEVALPCHIGYSQFPRDSSVVDLLLNFAGAARRHAKQQNSPVVQAYSLVHFIPFSKRVRLQSLMRHAVERNKLQLHYQPKTDVRTGKVTGVEVLVR